VETHGFCLDDRKEVFKGSIANLNESARLFAVGGRIQSDDEFRTNRVVGLSCDSGPGREPDRVDLHVDLLSAELAGRSAECSSRERFAALFASPW
jgi:hypothetical protein